MNMAANNNVNNVVNNDEDKITYKDIRSIFQEFFSNQQSGDNISSERSHQFLLQLLSKYAGTSGSAQRPPSSPTTTREMVMVEKNNNGKKVVIDAHPGEVSTLSSPVQPSGEPEQSNQQKSNKTQELEKLKEKLNEYKSMIDGLLAENDIARKENDTIKEELHTYKKKSKELEGYAKTKESEAQGLMKTLSMVDAQHKNEIYKYRDQANNLHEQLNNKIKECSELYKKNQELRDEASQYQSALGDARNYRLGDNDVNNPTQLTKEIQAIQDSINNFCKIKGGVDINEQCLASLLEHYKCRVIEPGDKVLAKAALQRYIIEAILGKTELYLAKELQSNEMNDNKYLELEVIHSTQKYLTILNKLVNTRKGTDEVSFAAPTKIRQLVNAVLGDRGFASSNDDKGYIEHEFIQELKKEIVDTMNNFRTIKKDDKRKENEDLAAEIIRNVIKMFVFRIKVLEPPGEIDWIERDSKIDPTLMEVGNLEDDNYDDWNVNLCSFPLIGVNLKSENERKVLVPAKIIAIKPSKDQTGITKLKNRIFGN